MAYCGPRGIPLSTFLGWPERDQEAALAWQSREASRCPGCGTYEADWDEAAGGSRTAWAADVHVCQGCVQLEAGRTQINNDTPNARGVHVRLTRPDRG